MLKAIARLLFDSEADAAVPAGRHGTAALRRAAAGLLVDVALLDGRLDEAERNRIADLLRVRFDLTEAETAALIAAAEAAATESVELYGLSRVLRDHFEHAERVAMIEMLWDVAYADGTLHPYEANMLRRIAGLLYVTDRESGAARKRVLARRGLDGD
ncbi:MAG: TerB family tellurite resistance protein [Alphaproteobacteria bacterium]